MSIISIFSNHRDHETACEKRVTVLIKELIEEIKQLRREVMATKQDVLDAIAAEKAQVTAAIEELDIQIQALKDQIAAGTAITPADLDDIASAVHDIFIPVEPPIV